METADMLGRAWQHQQAGEFNRAEQLYQGVLARDPGHPDALHLLGILTHQRGDSPTGAELVKQAISKRPEDAALHANLAMILEADGRIQDAIRHNRRAIELRPEHAGARLNLANELRIAGDIEAAVQAYRELLELEPQHAGAWSNLGSALRASGDTDGAVDACRRAIALLPENPDIHSNLGNALQGQGKYEEAVEAFSEATRLAPDFPDAHANLGVVHLQAGHPRRALAAFDACLEWEPANRTALAFKTIALCELDQPEAAAAITDLAHSIVMRRFDQVPGFPGIGDFNRALAKHVLNHPSAVYEPFSKTTRHGRQTGNLLLGNKGPIAKLEQMVNEAIRSWLEKMPVPPGHPYRLYKPGEWRLNMWATLLDSGGHQQPHIHPGGWLSGVYYVSLPPDENGDESGWIEFGQPPSEVPCTVQPETRLLEPEEGLLILFPSFFFHRTIPFSGEETRISIAFDAVPVA